MNETYVFYSENDHFVTLYGVVDDNSLKSFIEEWNEKAKMILENKMKNSGFEKEDITYELYRHEQGNGHVYLSVKAEAIQLLTHLSPPFNKSVFELYESISYGKTSLGFTAAGIPSVS